MLASFIRDGDGEVSAASKLWGLCLCMRTPANTGGDGGPLDEEDELAGEQAEAAGEEEDDDERTWLRETFGMYEMEGTGCITPLSLKLVLARLGARRNIAECQAIICRFDMDSDGVVSFNEFRTMMTA
ncbi:hypothetical protein BDA96_04G054100 [Sorghum bicolor]|uniref:EF-hand domain-containing protein n=2 Tax=Sorghum bicolor TaxID=4558 RepID=C5XVE6_SORBI|nr:hypothetical protein SORBI_3004G049000 [Sorghum bicolor]KAG0531804.1 hypothetical protein BDA96_04G054100 [Sorghum bicolor]